MPPEFKVNFNTTLFLGIHSNTNDIDMTLRVYANDDGQNIIDENCEFKGFEAKIVWDRINDVITSSDNLNSRTAKKVCFDKRLYRANGQQRSISNAREQGIVVEAPRIPAESSHDSVYYR